MVELKHSAEPSRQEVSVLTAPHWIATFVLIAVPTSLVPFFVGFLAGLSVAQDVVFGLYALVSGAFADFIIRWRFGKVLLVLREPRIPFIVFWALLCLYVMVARPFE